MGMKSNMAFNMFNNAITGVSSTLSTSVNSYNSYVNNTEMKATAMRNTLKSNINNTYNSEYMLCDNVVKNLGQVSR